MSIDVNFRNFCVGMWLDNCSERRSYGEDRLEYNDYKKANEKFLKEKYEEIRNKE